MHRILVDFIKVLRNADIKVSPAETLDAMQVMEVIGARDRRLLKHSLSITLSKTPEEKETFNQCFEKYFSFANHHEANEKRGSAYGLDHDTKKGSETEETSKTNQQSGGQGNGQINSWDEEEETNKSLEATSHLGKLLLSKDKTAVMMFVVKAGREIELNQIRFFTQKGTYTRKIMDSMGLKDLQQEIGTLNTSGSRSEMLLAEKLKNSREQLRQRIREYVEKQFLLHADSSGKQLREELLKQIKLSNLEKRYFKDVRELVFKMAKKLVAVHSKRRKKFRRGQLDVRKTLRKNMQYDGMFFDIKWKASKVDRPKVICICDVSGSVSSYSRFLLMFLYSLSEILPKVRAFAFSSDLGEVTKLFEESTLEDALAKTMRDFGNGSTDYGQMLLDFKDQYMGDVNKKTSVIILGDGRNNYGDPQVEILHEIYEKAQRVIWLNPEAKTSWYMGDAEMKKYAPCCHQTEVCNSLTHLERVVSNLMRFSF
ncbi:MAG: vWA domain-containing protein [Candidatus Azotimanducaceae bacterium]|uniref:VWA domain-containing protein n=1 Tax=OM182 bacterium TaxID=2510334 RepID=A0A520S313_9GAMM|nr:MAG: VWA domain-containing protein [OM182 bacterium]